MAERARGTRRAADPGPARLGDPESRLRGEPAILGADARAPGRRAHGGDLPAARRARAAPVRPARGPGRPDATLAHPRAPVHASLRLSQAPARGTVKWKVEPWSRLLSAQICPPLDSTMLLTR